MSEDGRKESKGSHSLLREVVFAAIVAAAKINDGLVIGWPSNLSKMKSGNNSSGFPIDSGESKLSITDDDIAWLASMMGLTLIVACFITGPLDEIIGPKRLLSLILIPLAGCWLLQAFTPYVSLLYVGRGLTVFFGAMITTLLSPLLAELCDTKHRGMVVSFSEIMLDLGLLGSYILAKFLSWRLATAFSALPFFILVVITPFVPESPFWLVEKNRIKDAETSLQRLRGPRSSSVAEELNAITSTTLQRNPSIFEQISKLKRARNAQPILLVSVIFMLREIGGKAVIFTYAVYMFTRTGVELDAFTCSILVGVVRLVFTLLSAYFLDNIGRRPILQCSSIVCGVSASLAGVVLIDDSRGSSWIPLAAVLLFVASYGLGLGPVPWVLIGELLPTPVRVLGASVVTSCGYLMLFVMNYVFPDVIDSVGLGWTLIFFALANFVLAAVVWAHLPETNNKTLQELETIFCTAHNDAACKMCQLETPQANLTPIVTIPLNRDQSLNRDQPWTDMQVNNGNVIVFYYNTEKERY
ncbi:facilitated trehalose transporter Tret1-like isoform X2 [Macrobrachium nipponense]